MDLVDAIMLVGNEAQRAAAKHRPMHSHHEAYAVIKEEFDEYWLEVQKGGSKPRDPEALKLELVQTAAMCIRTLTDLCSK
jgi:truncated hemoglobin YjbI